MTALAIHLDPARAARLTQTVANLEQAIAAGLVPNALFVDAKDTINRAIEHGAEAFLATGPRADDHNQSIWWRGAYHANALVSGAHNAPAAHKRAVKAGLTEYAAFIETAVLPLRTLLESAKPLIRKRGDMPKVKTARQIADEADQMTCQCCGRGIFAKLGTIAHHGYERPGFGYQTASCMGAKHLPFEVNRDRLADLIVALKHMQVRMIAEHKAIAGEVTPVTRTWKGGSFDFTRANFASGEAVHAMRKAGIFNRSFDDMLQIELANRASGIRSVASDITMHQARFDGWKQTHRWDTGSEGWEAL